MDKIYRGYGRCYGGGCDVMGILRRVSRGEEVVGRVFLSRRELWCYLERVSLGLYVVNMSVLVVGALYLHLRKKDLHDEASRASCLEYNREIRRKIIQFLFIGFSVMSLMEFFQVFFLWPM